MGARDLGAESHVKNGDALRGAVRPNMILANKPLPIDNLVYYYVGLLDEKLILEMFFIAIADYLSEQQIWVRVIV